MTYATDFLTKQSRETEKAISKPEIFFAKFGTTLNGAVPAYS